MKKILLRTAITVVVLVMIALVAVFFSLNAIVKKGVETVGPPMTKTDVRLGSADLSPFSGSGKLSTLFVGNPEGFTKTGFAIQLGSVAIAVKVSSVFSDTVEVESIDIEQPQISLEGTLNGNNLSKILDNLNAASATQEPQKNSPPPLGEKKAKKFIVKDLVLNGAKVRIDVIALNKSLNTTVSIPDIHLQNIGTGEGGVSAAELCRQLLNPLVAAAVKSASDELAKRGIDNLTKQGTSELKKSVGSALNNLLKKNSPTN